MAVIYQKEADLLVAYQLWLNGIPPLQKAMYEKLPQDGIGAFLRQYPLATCHCSRSPGFWAMADGKRYCTGCRLPLI